MSRGDEAEFGIRVEEGGGDIEMRVVAAADGKAVDLFDRGGVGRGGGGNGRLESDSEARAVEGHG